MTRLTALAAAIAATLAPGSIVAADEFGVKPSPGAGAAQRPIGDPDDDEGGLEEDDEDEDEDDEDDEEPMQLRESPAP